MRHTPPAGVLLTALLGLGGCAVGPDYHRPTVDTVAAYKEQGDWKPSEPDDVLSHGDWWRIFNDPVLDGLERQIEVSNQTLKAAEDAYRQATGLVDQARGALWPSIGVSAAHERGQLQGGGPTTTTNSLTGTASWQLDLWGQIRRTVESDLATAQASEAGVAAARLLAQATLAIDYFDLRAQDSLEAIYADTVSAEQRSLQITQSRYSFGVAAKADVVTAQTQLLSSQAQQVNAAIARAQYEHAISVLIGKQPGAFSLPAMPLGAVVPTTPTGLPSTLLERRPDVAQAERRMAAANAQIGVAKAAFFPNLTLAASGGYSSVGSLSQLIGAPNRVWGLGPTLAETLFEGGARRAALAQARAGYDIAIDNYRQTVLTSFQQVEDNLVALRVLAQQAGIETETVAAAREAERLTLNQYRAGTVPYTSVITAQTITLSSEQTELTVLLGRLSASVSLIEALGGGWNAATLR
jgi:NodT family efflux transporter outer membrane factor (OMF) lipoprotein